MLFAFQRLNRYVSGCFCANVVHATGIFGSFFDNLVHFLLSYLTVHVFNSHIVSVSILFLAAISSDRLNPPVKQNTSFNDLAKVVNLREDLSHK